MCQLHGARLKDLVEWSHALAGLSDRRKKRVSKFSGGMKRRLNIVCGQVHDPQIVFLDEPTVGVDPQSRVAVFERIDMLMTLGWTIVHTTHYMEEAQRLCDRVAIIDYCKISDLDTAKNLLNQHGGKAVVIAEMEAQPADSLDLPGVCSGLSFPFESCQPLQRSIAERKN